MRIYLDNAATTKPYPEVRKLINDIMEESYCNASSVHTGGAKSAVFIEKARMIIAAAINAQPGEIYFTSGGTEANNTAIRGFLTAHRFDKVRLIASSVEHPSIREVMKWAVAQDAKVTFLPVDSEGFVNPADVEKAIDDEPTLVTVMHANNEVGTIEPIKEIGALCKERNALFHTDACQSFTKVKLDVEKCHIDMATLNAHKIHGPKGVGALYIRKGTDVDSFMLGGGQEGDFRAGTYNTPGIAGFGKAVELSGPDSVRRMSELRDGFIARIRNRFDGVMLNGPEGDMRLCNNINLIFPGLRGKDIFMELNKAGVDISTGSACSSTKTVPSRVLMSMGLGPEMANGAIRISISAFTEENETSALFDRLVSAVEKLGNN